MRSVWGLLIVVGLAMGFAVTPVLGTSPISDPLAQKLDNAAPDEFLSVSVVLREQLSADYKSLLTAGKTKSQARTRVVSQLKRVAETAQAPLLTRLERMRAAGFVRRIRPLWLGNLIGIEATPDVIRRLSTLPDIARISLVASTPISKVVQGHEETNYFPTCGQNFTDADRVWEELHVLGEGTLVAVIDSGVCWSHPDIVDQIWVNPGEDLDGDGEVMDADDANGVDDDGNGFVDDFIGWDFDSQDNDPSDTNGHGTHVAGTVASDGTFFDAGTAPRTRVMVLQSGIEATDEIDAWSAMQYAVDNGADVIQMSMGWSSQQNPDRSTWRMNADNAIDAGLVMVVSAGNDGGLFPPRNVRTPADVPRVIAVGAINCSGSQLGFSSVGPVQWADVPPYNDYPYPPGLIKPDFVAPGQDIESLALCSGYEEMEGTSMAAPHVSGTVALMLSEKPSLDPAQIEQVLIDATLDRGAPGKDNSFGWGNLRTFEAVSAVSGLQFDSVTVLDDDPNHGNANGALDDGEIAKLVVRLENLWEARTATGVRGFLRTNTQGAEVVENFAEWADVPPLSLADTQAPHFSLKIEQGCNFRVDLTLDLQYDDRETRHSFSVLVGSETPDAVLFADDFEADAGWLSGGDALTGQFVRQDPNGFLDSSSRPVQPEDDATADPGTLAWITGNADVAPGTDDVDAGTVHVTSPLLDASAFQDLTLDYQRWFYAAPVLNPPLDFLRALWSVDGTNWNLLEEVGDMANAWTPVSVPLPPSALAAGLRVRFEVLDDPIFPGESVIEGLVDDVSLTGTAVTCDSFSLSGVQPPNEVGNTLMVSHPRTDELLFAWQAPPTDVTHDAATFYRLYRSASPDTSFVSHGSSTDTTLRQVFDPQSSTLFFYLVGAENGGGTSGEEPAP